MATEIRTGIRLTGDATGMNAAMASGEKALGRFNREIDSAAKGTERLGQSVKTVAHYGAALVAATAGWQLGKQAIAAADEMSVLQSRLKLVTANAQDLAAVQGRLFAIAQQGRTSYAELGATYAQIARSSASLGVSQNRLLGVTESISQAMAIGGGSAASMNAALIQLSQGLASGTLRGEELNSIMEQTPRLAQAIAQGMGVSLGQLRALGQDGKLTTLTVIEALEKAAPALRREFEQVTPTVSGAFQTLKNSSTLFISEFDKATGTSRSLADMLSTLASGITAVGENIKKYDAQWAVLAGAATWAVGLGAAALAYSRFVPMVARLGAALVANPMAAALLGVAAVGGLLANGDTVQAKMAAAEQRLRLAQGVLNEDEGARRRGEGARYSEATLASAREAVRKAQREQADLGIEQAARNPYAERRFEAGYYDDPNAPPYPNAKPLSEVLNYVKTIEGIQRAANEKALEIYRSFENSIALATSDNERIELTKQRKATLIGLYADANAEIQKLGQQAANDLKQLDEARYAEQKASLELAASIEQRSLAERQRSNEQFRRLNLIDEESYQQRKSELEVEGLGISNRVVEAELAKARAIALTTAKLDDKLQAQARVLGLEKELVEIEQKRRAAAAAPGEARDVRDYERRKSQSERDAQARTNSTQSGYALDEQMRAQTRQIGINAIRDEGERARAQLAQEMSTLAALIDNLDGGDAKTKALESFNELVLAKTRQLNEQLKPEWQKMLNDWADATAQMKEAYDRTMKNMLKGGEDAFVRSGGNLLSLAKSIGQMIQDELLRGVYRKFISPVVSSLGSGLLSLLGFGAHGGAIVGKEASFTRSVHPAVFAGAERFHTGGLVGGEVPIIAKRGEGVFTPEQMRALAPAQAGAGAGMQIKFAPVTNIQVDARSDRAAIEADTQRALRENNKQMLDQLRRIGVVPA